MSRKPPQRKRHASGRQRHGQPYFLLWIVCGLAALFGAQQLALHRELVAAPRTIAVEPPNLIVETTRLIAMMGSGPSGNGDTAAQAEEHTEPDVPLPAPRLTAADGPTDLRWAGPDPTSFISDAALATRVTERIAGRSGRYGVAIKDLRSGRGVLVDADTRFEAASLFKLAVMYEVFRQREAGTLSFGENLQITQRHVEWDLGTLDRPAGSWISIGEALERMVTISDNSAAILLADRVGPGNVTRNLNSLGLTRTRYSVEDLSTSPADMLLLLEAIARGEAVSREASADMIHLLSRQRVHDRIPRLLPAGTIVAHKTGNLPGVVNDVGIVYGGDQIFVVAVLVEGTRNDGEATRITGELAAIAYEHFQANGGSQVTVRTMGEPVPTPAPWPTPRPVPTDLPRPPATTTPTAVEPDPTPLAPIVPPTIVTPRPPTAEAAPPTTIPQLEPQSPMPAPAVVSSPTPVPQAPATAPVAPLPPAIPHTATPLPLPGQSRSVPGGGNVPGVIAPASRATPGR
jgi:beta-lactamase class A